MASCKNDFLCTLSIIFSLLTLRGVIAHFYYTATDLHSMPCLKLQTACKENSVQWPAADGFCYPLINEQVTFFGEFKLQKKCNQFCSSKVFFRVG